MTPVRTRHITTTSIVRYLIAAAVLGSFILYISFQARLLIAGPQISLLSNPSPVQHERQITLEGIAENITSITLNGRAILTDENGRFSESLVLENGYTIVKVQAHDRYGRETTLERPFVYAPVSPLIN